MREGEGGDREKEDEGDDHGAKVARAARFRATLPRAMPDGARRRRDLNAAFERDDPAAMRAVFCELEIVIVEDGEMDVFRRFRAMEIFNAIRAGATKCVRALVVDGVPVDVIADRSVQSGANKGPLQLAAALGYVNMVGELLSLGADPNFVWRNPATQGKDYGPILCYLCGIRGWEGSQTKGFDGRLAECICLILEAGADPNACYTQTLAPSFYPRYAFHEAALHNFHQVVPHLLAAGVNPYVRGGPWMETPLEMARRMENGEFVHSLLAHGVRDQDAPGKPLPSTRRAARLFFRNPEHAARACREGFAGTDFDFRDALVTIRRSGKQTLTCREQMAVFVAAAPPDAPPSDITLDYEHLGAACSWYR